MKLKKENKFQPVNIKLETQKEIDLLFAILNFGSITEALGINENSKDATIRSFHQLWTELRDCKSSSYQEYHYQLRESI